MNDGFMNHSFEPFWPGRQWQATKPENNFGYSYYGNGVLDYDRRAAAFAYWATWAPKRLGDPKKLPASYYLKNFRDSTGALFRGDRSLSAARTRRHAGARLLVDHRLRSRHQRLHPQPGESCGRVVVRQAADGRES